jgi:23S rRNA A2030 N6-methylase RlmJ
VVNPPWQWDEELQTLGEALAVALNRPEARTIVEWLVPEAA